MQEKAEKFVLCYSSLFISNLIEKSGEERMVPQSKPGSNGWNAVELLPASSPCSLQPIFRGGCPRLPIEEVDCKNSVNDIVQRLPFLVGDVLHHFSLEDYGADYFYVFGLAGQGFLKSLLWVINDGVNRFGVLSIECPERPSRCYTPIPTVGMASRLTSCLSLLGRFLSFSISPGPLPIPRGLPIRRDERYLSLSLH